MDLNDIQAEIDELRGAEDAEDSLEIIVNNVGKLAKGELLFDERDLAEDTEGEQRRDVVASVVTACMEYAAEHDLDMNRAMEERLEYMHEVAEQREAMEEMDAAGIVEQVTDDGESGDDGGSGRGFY